MPPASLGPTVPGWLFAVGLAGCVAQGPAATGIPAPQPDWPRALLATSWLDADAGTSVPWPVGAPSGMLVWTPRAFPGADRQPDTWPGRRTALMQRLALGPGAVSRRAQTQPVRHLGDQDVVRVIDLLPGGRPCARLLELRAITPRALYWVDIGPTAADPCQAGSQPVPDGLLQGWVDRIDGPDASILGRLEAVFGAVPPEADVDGDPRVHVIFSSAVGSFGKDKGLEGFFWPADLEGDGVSGSNRREAVYLRAGALLENQAEAAGVLAHELTHLLVFAGRRSRGAAVWPTWWDEGIAMWAMGRTGHGLPEGRASLVKDVAAVLAEPGAWSLSDWAGNPGGGGYGLAYLYLEWLHERYGEALVREVLADPADLDAALARALAKRGSTPRRAFLDLGVALAAVGGHVRTAGLVPEPPAGLLASALFDAGGGPWFTGARARLPATVPGRPGVLHTMATLAGPTAWQPPVPAEAVRLDFGPVLAAVGR
ncbi:MAG: hypothetical protein FJY99_13520 [Candidatus Sericytochromatia bacterium]|nr:hypothetical protein [Candidatus Tanganyikabacteria bacterium]